MSKGKNIQLKQAISQISNKNYVRDMDFTNLDAKSFRAMDLFLQDVRQIRFQRDRAKSDLRNGKFW
jgi:hypothetical protein